MFFSSRCSRAWRTSQKRSTWPSSTGWKRESSSLADQQPSRLRGRCGYETTANRRMTSVAEIRAVESVKQVRIDLEKKSNWVKICDCPGVQGNHGAKRFLVPIKKDDACCLNGGYCSLTSVEAWLLSLALSSFWSAWCVSSAFKFLATDYVTFFSERG